MQTHYSNLPYNRLYECFTDDLFRSDQTLKILDIFPVPLRVHKLSQMKLKSMINLFLMVIRVGALSLICKDNVIC